MILIFIALLVVSIFFPPAWLALAGYAIYVFSSRKSRRDEAVESRVKKLIAAGRGYSTFSDLYFDAARKYAEDKGGTSEHDYASVRMIVSDRLYSVSFMNDGGGGTNISVRDWRDVENEIERDLKERQTGRAEKESFEQKNGSLADGVSPSQFLSEYISRREAADGAEFGEFVKYPSWADASSKVNEFSSYVASESARAGVADAYVVGMILQREFINFAFACMAEAEENGHSVDFQKNIGVCMMQMFWEGLDEDKKSDLHNTKVTKEYMEGIRHQGGF